MSKEETLKYVCSQCGYVSPKWNGRCPECGAWNSFAEEVVSKVKASSGSKSNASSQLLANVPRETEFRFSSGITELDRVLGGGIVNSSSVLVGGEPGIGKSTLMLQVSALCSARRKVIYISGEESANQVRQRAERITLDTAKIYILCETKLSAILHVIEEEKPQLLIVDSLQTLQSEEVSSVAGSVTQIRTCCMEIINACKACNTSVFFIGHVTKEGTLAGPKIIEHMVDTVVYFEQAATGIRLVRSAKNRFGSVDEIGIFSMTETGLFGVKDPSSFFISERNGELLPPGIAYTSIVEGSRAFVVEIQALTVEAKTGFSHVYSDKIDNSRVLRVAAILERHAGIRLADKDIYVNVAGGIKVNDVSVELALAVALVSAVSSKSLSSKMVCFGELSLAGEVRPVTYCDKRIKATSELGFKKALVPFNTDSKADVSLAKCQKVTDVFKIMHQKPSA